MPLSFVIIGGRVYFFAALCKDISSTSFVCCNSVFILRQFFRSKCRFKCTSGTADSRIARAEYDRILRLAPDLLAAPEFDSTQRCLFFDGDLRDP